MNFGAFFMGLSGVPPSGVRGLAYLVNTSVSFVESFGSKA